MRRSDSPSLLETTGHRIYQGPQNQLKEPITIIRSNYLKNLQAELLEERAIEEAPLNNDIVYIQVKLNGVLAEAMIDTGANVSIIDQLELDRITELTTERIPTLPINNMTIIGATGKQNKTIRKQVSLNVTNSGIGIPMEFLVAKGLPFRILIGCDMLRRHTAIINLASGKVTPVSYTHLDVYKRQL